MFYKYKFCSMATSVINVFKHADLQLFKKKSKILLNLANNLNRFVFAVCVCVCVLCFKVRSCRRGHWGVNHSHDTCHGPLKLLQYVREDNTSFMTAEYLHDVHVIGQSNQIGV